MRIAAVLVVLSIACSSISARADDIATAQGVIRAQEQALSHDDAAAAYSYAAPTIREIFPAPDIFMSMVQNGYAPVYRHKSFEFGESKIEGSSVAQRVHIIDANGEAWEALYTLEQQADGGYKITGCSLLKAGQAV
ncbi:hypothetical protein ABID59_004911 [Bradyrhizobium sp. S3.3.6]|uniref:DUF4864 domain-containing protein n=1 Tax=Bradyrhizobium sp. S3.3.6 TaxID=3156429 RepID=UPI003394D749